MKKFILTLIILLATFLNSQATTYVTTGKGQGVWSDPLSWRIVGQSGVPAHAPTAQDNVRIEHYLTHTLHQDYAHLGNLFVGAKGTYEVISGNEDLASYGFHGSRLKVEGALMIEGDLEHVGSGELIFCSLSWVSIAKNLNLKSSGGLLNLNTSCGSIQIGQDLLTDVDRSFIAGEGVMTVHGQIKPYRAYSESHRAVASQMMAGVMDASSKIFSSASACQGSDPAVEGLKNERSSVQWNSFEAVLVEKGAQLQWKTLSESFGVAFFIERSADGLAFEKLVEIPAKGRQDVATTYQFLDSTVTTSQVYYRIRYSNLEGQREISETRRLSLSIDGGQLDLYPNPYHTGMLTMKNQSLKEDAPVIVSVHNIGGQLVSRFGAYTHAPGTLKLKQLDQLQTGMYIVTLQQEDFRVSKQLLVN